MFSRALMIVLTPLLLALPGAAHAAKLSMVALDVSGGILNMRSGPGVGHDVVIAIPAGTGNLDITSCVKADDNSSIYPWCRTTWEGHTGWVSSQGIEQMAGTEAPHHYPLMFTSDEKLRASGIDFGVKAGDPEFHNRCYYYGDGGIDLAVSDAFLAFYRAKGFTRESLCLGLISGIRFNPETGNQLANFIFVDDPQLLKTSPDSFMMIPELPLALPDCFKNALPYSDCAWNFDPLTGVRLPASDTRAYAKLGKTIERWLTAHSAPTFDNQCDSKTGEFIAATGQELIAGMLCADGYWVDVGDQRSAASVYVTTPRLPKGHGYALYADGGAGPEVSPDVMQQALDGVDDPAQVDPNDLAAIWGEGSGSSTGASSSDEPNSN